MIDLRLMSTWLGIIGYSWGVGVCIVWVGICVANWQITRNWVSMWLGLAAVWGALFIASLTAIASDWFPSFSGIYIALMIRLSFLACMISLTVFTYLYLQHKRRGRERTP